MERTYEKWFAQFPDTATTCTVLDKMIKKAKHAKKHYKDGDEQAMLEHLDELHTMIEAFVKIHKGV